MQKPFRPTSSQHWKDQKASITEAYTNMRLSDQYKKQLHKWGLDSKRIKAPEYKAMIRKKRRREDGVPSKKTVFLLRGKEVEDDKIARLEKSRKITDGDHFSDRPTR